MEIIEVEARSQVLIAQLETVWENSVKETHLFLSEGEITAIKKYIPQALTEIPHLLIAKTKNGAPIGFMGIDGQKLQMLFIEPAKRRHGLGKKLLKYGIKKYRISELVVNEQNPQAKGFYEHMGFKVYKRTETDEQGMPYPILYMRL